MTASTSLENLPPAPLMRQLVVTGPKQMRLHDAPVPRVAPGQALCRVEYVGLCGVDRSLSEGYSTYIREGLQSYPFVLGHEWSGMCVDVAEDLPRDLVGRRVVGHNFIVCGVCAACRSNRQEGCIARSEMGIVGAHPGALSELIAVPASVLSPLPDAIDDRSAVLLEPSTTALHALRRTETSASDHVLILGTGTVGLCTVLLARSLGAEVTVAGIDEAALTFARELGADHACRTDSIPADRFSVVVEASGAPSAIAAIPSAVAPAGRVALVGVPNEAVEGLAVSALVMKNVTLEAIYSGIHHWEELIRIVARHRIDLGSLVDAVHPLHEFEAAFAALASPARRRPKTLIRVATDELKPADERAGRRRGEMHSTETSVTVQGS